MDGSVTAETAGLIAALYEPYCDLTVKFGSQVDTYFINISNSADILIDLNLLDVLKLAMTPTEPLLLKFNCSSRSIARSKLNGLVATPPSSSYHPILLSELMSIFSILLFCICVTFALAHFNPRSSLTAILWETLKKKRRLGSLFDSACSTATTATATSNANINIINNNNNMSRKSLTSILPLLASSSSSSSDSSASSATSSMLKLNLDLNLDVDINPCVDPCVDYGVDVDSCPILDNRGSFVRFMSDCHVPSLSKEDIARHNYKNNDSNDNSDNNDNNDQNKLGIHRDRNNLLSSHSSTSSASSNSSCNCSFYLPENRSEAERKEEVVAYEEGCSQYSSLIFVSNRIADGSLHHPTTKSSFSDNGDDLMDDLYFDPCRNDTAGIERNLANQLMNSKDDMNTAASATATSSSLSSSSSQNFRITRPLAAKGMFVSEIIDKIENLNRNSSSKMSSSCTGSGSSAGGNGNGSSNSSSSSTNSIIDGWTAIITNDCK